MRLRFVRLLVSLQCREVPLEVEMEGKGPSHLFACPSHLCLLVAAGQQDPEHAADDDVHQLEQAA